MTGSRRYQGVPVSGGKAAGQLFYLAGPQDGQRAAGPDEVEEAFAAVARERSALAQQLRQDGRDEQADIVAVGGMIAADPTLIEPAVAAVRDGADAADAVGRSAAVQADAIAALANPDLAARADDVRQVANAVLARLAGGGTTPPAGDFILVGREVDPADLIRLTESGLAGAVSVSGGANSHAAIIARGLGVPMLAGADPEVLAAGAGQPAILDATAGQLIVDPPPQELAAFAPPGAPARARGAPGQAEDGGGGPGSAAPGTPPRTRDGQEITLLCNVASATETRLGLSSGAAGVGLLRTEIPFLKAAGWPSEADHRAALDPVLSLLTGKPAVVRLLDFAGDKTPPFLAGQGAGLDMLLTHPSALGDQLRAVLRSGRDTQLRVMVPMVSSLDEMAAVRAALAGAAAEVGAAMPPLGMMVEVSATAAAAGTFTSVADFFSIGTNDLTSQVLGIDRADPRMRPALAADPRVLTLISRVVKAAGAAGVSVSVCGDAAADPDVLPLLIGLGVRTLSVGAARLPDVAARIAGADAVECAAVAARALQAASVEQVWAHVQAP